MKRLVILLVLAVLMAQAVIVQASPTSSVGFECFGAAREAWRYRGPEFILAGPYETGKTIAALNKLHLLMCKYPGAQGLMVRKTYKSLVSSAVVTFEKKVLPVPPNDPRSQVAKFGGEKPEFYDYPNGSRLYLVGMDNPDRFLSAEYDFIYVNQAEELTLDDWEKLTGRATGRAGNAPYSQVFGDCNPADPQHWILNRPRLKIFYSSHEDNPTLFNQATGEITERGKKTLETLDALTGVRYKRGRKGLWVAAEGQVYEDFDPAIHLVDQSVIQPDWRRVRAIDFGYTNPFVCQWWAIDHDGRMYLYREIYYTQRLVEDLASDILRLEAQKTIEEWQEITRQYARDPGQLTRVRQSLAAANERIATTVCDHDAEDRATLERHGLSVIPARKMLTVGLQAVEARLRKAGDGKPRLYFCRDTLVARDPGLAEKFKPCCLVDEFPVYVWPMAKDGRPIKEEPVKEFDHGMDAMRYGVMYIDQNSGAAVYVGSRRVG